MQYLYLIYLYLMIGQVNDMGHHVMSTVSSWERKVGVWQESGSITGRWGVAGNGGGGGGCINL